MSKGGDMNEPETHRDTSGEELTRGTLGAAWSTEMRLSAAQMHGDETPSWKAPREKSRRWSTARLIAIVVAAAAVLLIVLRIIGII